MAFTQGMTRPEGAGRHKGSRNKLRQSLADDILEVFYRMGGVKGLEKWAEESKMNKLMYYTRILPRILPLQVGGVNGAPISINLLPQDETL